MTEPYPQTFPDGAVWTADVEKLTITVAHSPVIEDRTFGPFEDETEFTLCWIEVCLK